MTEEARIRTAKLREELTKIYPKNKNKDIRFLMTIGVADKELHVYEHERGLAPYRSITEIDGWKVLYSYVGKIKPASV